MADILIRDIPEDVLAAIDSAAARLGLSRNEYLRRELSQITQRCGPPVTVDDLRRLAGTFDGLTDPDLMDRAWK